MANVKEPVTTHNCILKYAIIEQIQQLEEDSKLTKLPTPSKYSLLEQVMVRTSASKYKRNKAILN